MPGRMVVGGIENECYYTPLLIEASQSLLLISESPLVEQTDCLSSYHLGKGLLLDLPLVFFCG